jgi:phosphoribosylanthranilate isomerase
MVRVKICGITNYQDAAIAVESGADAIGLIFARSPRHITPEKAREIICAMPPFVQTVGVFVNEKPDAIRQIMRFCGLDLIQFHGDEAPEVCDGFMPKAIKAFRPRDGSVLQWIKPYQGKIKAILLDTYAEESRGGTGKIFDWDLAVRGKDLEIPIILSGGLTPSNIERAISTVNPFAVDVNSGVEKRPGKKDRLLVRELMEKIRKVNHKGQLDE